VAPDGENGAYIIWEDERTGVDINLYAQRLDHLGAARWTNNGIGISTWTGDQSSPHIVSDGAGGFIAAWIDNRQAGNHEIYGQRMASNATPLWTPGGARIMQSTYQAMYLKQVEADGLGGILILILEGPYFENQYAVRCNAEGLMLYQVLIGEDSYSSLLVAGSMSGDGAGGAYLTWTEYNTADDINIRAQRLGPAGNPLWTQQGALVCADTGIQITPAVVTVDSDATVVAWIDYRHPGSEPDIYGQRLNLDGDWGEPRPLIESVLDVPGDQGGLVTLTWHASDHDEAGDIAEYSVWRALDDPPLCVSGDLRVQTCGGQRYFWELVHMHDAYQLPDYAATVPTLFDSTAICDDLHHFQVIAHTVDPDIFYISPSDSGYSVDDLAPGAPLNLIAEEDEEEIVLLTWEASGHHDEDLDHYRVYRGVSSGFPLDLDHLIGTSPTEAFEDTPGAGTWYYRCTGVDVHRNEGEASNEATVGTGTAVPHGPPSRFALYPNYPNPFNPGTRIPFALPVETEIRIQVTDMSGRVLRVLAEGRYPAGLHEIDWDGRDEQGRRQASGIYFCELESERFTEKRKMTLLK
jgi:hypothetical protein